MTFAIEAMDDAEVMQELVDLQTGFTEQDFVDLEHHLKLRAACLHWTGDPLKQPPRSVLACARLVVEARHAYHAIGRRLSELATNGFWYCISCESVCDRIEGENGQPARCSKCSSHRIHFSRLE